MEPRDESGGKRRGIYAKKSLFGEVDHEEIAETLRTELSLQRERDKMKWNFDFERGVPLEGRYSWEPFGPGEETGAKGFHPLEVPCDSHSPLPGSHNTGPSQVYEKDGDLHAQKPISSTDTVEDAEVEEMESFPSPPSFPSSGVPQQVAASLQGGATGGDLIVMLEKTQDQDQDRNNNNTDDLNLDSKNTRPNVQSPGCSVSNRPISRTFPSGVVCTEQPTGSPRRPTPTLPGFEGVQHYEHGFLEANASAIDIGVPIPTGTTKWTDVPSTSSHSPSSSSPSSLRDPTGSPSGEVSGLSLVSTSPKTEGLKRPTRIKGA